jgi:LacI family transcriptional regulator
MAKRPTVYDVAERAGVSIATVSFTFRQPTRVKESTRDLVHAAAYELGYIPSANARALAGGRTGALGLLSLERRPDSADPEYTSSATSIDTDVDFRSYPVYVDEVQRGVEEECWRRGYALMVADASRSNRSAVLTDIAGRVDGLVVQAGAFSDRDLRRVAARLPIAILSESKPDDDLVRISVDNTAGMRELTEHLLVEHGCREPLFVGPQYDADRIERFDAFRAVLRAAGLAVQDEPLASTLGFHGERRTDVYRHMIADLKNRNALPDAFVCVSDSDAIVLMELLRDANIDVPGQIAVTGFDGVVAGRLVSPALTTVRQPLATMGVAAVELLADRIEHPDEPPKSRKLPVKLVVRQSCGCPAN